MTTTSHTIIGVYTSRAQAESAVSDLLAEGYPKEKISLLTPTSQAAKELEATPHVGPLESIGSGSGAGAGAAIGTVSGLIAGIAALAIPGIGPLLAVGPLTAGIMGAGVGAAAGSIAGAMKQHGVTESDAEHYTEALRAGKCLVAVTTIEDRVDKAADILERHGADVDESDDAIVTPQTSPTYTSPTTSVTPSRDAIEAASLKEGDSLRDRQRRRERRVNIYPGITGSGAPTETI